MNIDNNQDFLEILNKNNQVPDYDVLAALKKEGLNKEDYLEIFKRLDRCPNRTELGMFGVMWSEHCCYRNSKKLLSQFPTKGPNILVGPGENAGVIDIGDGQKLAFKIESHNHPSAIEPFQGAATGVGGILRDIFTMGARPIALLNALRFGPLEDKKNVSLLEGVVSGIAHYGNCVGVPTIGGELVFDESYSGNPLVNAMALGLMETDDIVKSGAEGIGNLVIYVGSTTGRDGMGGASFASSELTKSSIDDRPAVQVGDPFFEKGLIEACLETFKDGDVVAAQDMGAAGLTCSSSEMAAKGDVGIELNLDLVPAREENMTAYEFLLSESQERMLFVVKPHLQEKVMKRFKKWGLYSAVVGKVIEEKFIRVIHNNEIVANIPTKSLAEDTPVNDHALLEDIPLEIEKHWEWKEDFLVKDSIKGIKLGNDISDWNSILLLMLDNPTIASKKWVYSQYDYQVQLNTLEGPGKADASLIRIREQDFKYPKKNTNKSVAVVVDCPNRWVFLDPERGSISAVAESARNISCVGATPLAITNNLNFSSPENSIGYWRLAKSCEGISNACKFLNTPVTGGNVSLYNETKSVNGDINPIQPTPVIGMVGLLNDFKKRCDISFKNNDDLIFLLGVPFDSLDSPDERVTLSASAYLEYIHNKLTGRPPYPDLVLEKNIQFLLRGLIDLEMLNSAHDISDGGLSISLVEKCISSGFGAHINLPSINSRIDRMLFAEGGSRVIVSVSKNRKNDLEKYIDKFNADKKLDLVLTPLGKVTSNKFLSIMQGDSQLISLSLSDLNSCFENALPRRIQSPSI